VTPIFVGLLVLGGVLLGLSLLVGTPQAVSLRTLGFWGLLCAATGLSAVALVAIGRDAGLPTLGLSLGVGAAVALAAAAATSARR